MIILRRLKIENGDKYGSLTILAEVNKQNNFRMFECECDCGSRKTFRLNDLRNGHASSCGCLRVRSCSTHRMSKCYEYKVWQDIKTRCLNKRHKSFGYYGGRGIKVCDRWMKFESFYEDMGPKPGPGYSIDRIDNDGDYCPENCRWATKKEQNSNTRRRRVLKIGGVSRSVAEWSLFTGTKYGTIGSRLARGWNEKDAVYGREK